MGRVVEVSGLRYRYDDGTAALDGADFSLDAGECVALLGPNGSGKTTFVLHLNGLLRGEGRIEICGIELRAESLSEIRRRVGIVFQESEEQLFMPTVLQDVMFGPLNAGLPVAEALEKAMHALSMVGMTHVADKAPYHLSAGEKRKVAIAGVLTTAPEILILDEPTTFLDPPGHRELTRILASLSQARIIVTHDVHFARALTGRAVFFEKGRISADGPLEEIVQRFGWDAGP